MNDFLNIMKKNTKKLYILKDVNDTRMHLQQTFYLENDHDFFKITIKMPHGYAIERVTA